ncbi:prepilin-type N-terminal cleavage/methylation domain-containing protein [Comamonas sp. JNW]|uniref:type IV pilin protein n=1 Tax=Comamonas sp. JNW TaxID=2170731 RepID=UPI000DE72C24|nr:prepilin-type N-terminal cleavage/methylation domain-containing protein [Comamonas sp. JNW]PWB17881.1 hypothetical protein DCO45_13280 [Comamonas sp. JNW]
MHLPQRNRGFTLIELMIVVAIIGILAAIAYPSYRDYVLRSKIAEAVAAMETMRTDMERFYQDHRTYDGDSAPCAGTRSVDAFDITCTGTRDSNEFTIAASGKNIANGFTYTINQLNERKTTAVPDNSGYNTCSAANGWMIRKGQACPS